MLNLIFCLSFKDYLQKYFLKGIIDPKSFLKIKYMEVDMLKIKNTQHILAKGCAGDRRIKKEHKKLINKRERENNKKVEREEK